MTVIFGIKSLHVYAVMVETDTGHKKFAFHPKKVADQNIFKIPEIALADVFVSDVFAERLRNSDLKGYKLVEMWDSEEE